MERTNWKKSWPFWLLLAMVLAYFALICAVNFFAPPSFYDSDMYTDMRYAEEMWKHKSIFPDGWVFGNQLYAVSTPVVAGLFYGLTRNPVLAMGLASTVLAALVLLSFDWMLHPVVSGREGRMAGVLAFLWMVLFFEIPGIRPTAGSCCLPCVLTMPAMPCALFWLSAVICVVRTFINAGIRSFWQRPVSFPLAWEFRVRGKLR